MDLIFKALSDPSRRKILDLLRKKDMSVSELQSHFNFTQASLSHHLDILKRAQLLTVERQGQFMIYSLNLSVFESVVKFLFNFFKE
ncbi:MAG TPA: autorepressor SdpR family transcription factor [bacterium]|nr:autorepressor SdpR family transcription factor [bacterium]